MIHNYSFDAFRDEKKEAYETAEGMARAYGKNFSVTSDLTLDAAREYLYTLPEDEVIDMTFGNCLGVRVIRWLYPQALENDFHFISYTTARGSFADGTTFWHVPANYDFADLMWQCYEEDTAPGDKITARELLKLIREYGE